MTGKYGMAPVPMTIGTLPAQPVETPSDMRVVKHLIGYTEVTIENGDVIRLHLLIDRLVFDQFTGGFNPSYRIVPEVVKKGWSSCAPLEGPLS